MKNILVSIRKDEPFTNSKVIAEGTDNQHHAVQQIIEKYRSDFEDFGALAFEMRVLKHKNYRGSTREKIYYLNEEQATLLMTYLRNSEKVRAFKKELVRQFFAIQKALLEKQTKLWEDARHDNKSNRLKETDIIKQLVEYAKEQGSTHSDKLYMVYTKLAKSIIKNKRDFLTVRDINTITLMESVILQTIKIGMAMDKDYKEIYRDCKERIEKFADITYLSFEEAV